MFQRRGRALSFAIQPLKSFGAINILKEIQSNPRNYISKQEFAKICKLNDRDSEEMLTHFVESGNVIIVKKLGQDLIITKTEPIFEYLDKMLEHTEPLSPEEIKQTKIKLGEIESKIEKIERKSRFYANVVSTGGLAILLGQFGLYAYLTWGVLSWDIMEPITYFTGQVNLILSYVYFLWAKREHSLEKQYIKSFESKREKLFRRNGIDLAEYSKLQNRLKFIRSE